MALDAATAGGRFAEERLADVLAVICRRAGLDHRGAQLLRFTNNAVFRLSTTPVVVRIVCSRALRHRVGKVVQIANWLAAHEVPAVRLWSGIEQPVVVGQDLATVWRWEKAVGHRASAKDLAHLLRRLHELPPPEFDLPRWAPLDDVRRRLADAEELTVEDREFLERRCALVQVRLDELRFAGDERVVHGDAHLGNVIAGNTGPLLCDFDSTCLGPREVDLVPLPVGVLRFGHPRRAYRQFRRVYGYDVMRWEGFDVLREVRELKLATSVLPIMRSRPEVRAELSRRLTDFRRGDGRARWTRYR